MKRKFKLLTSIASLCLAVALMAFGVYAATAPTLNVTGTVSFSASNVYATVTMQQGTAKDLDSITLNDVTVTNGVWTVETADANANATANADANLTDTTPAYKYVITIKSDFSEGSQALVKGTFGDSIPSSSDTGVTVTAKISVNDGEATDIAANGTFEIPASKTAVITVTVVVDPALADSTVSVDTGLSISFARA